MRKIVYCLLCFLLLPNMVSAAATSAQIVQQINQYITQTNKNINIGIQVMDLKTGQMVYSRNSDRTFTPASNQKALTAIAALQQLGPEYQFKTRVSTNNPLMEAGAIKGDLVFQFSGDPELRVKDLDELIAQLKAKGLSKVMGDVYVDDSAYGSQEFGPGWMWDDSKYCFSAPIGAFILNQNCINIQIAPGAKVNAPIQVSMTDSTRYINIVNTAVTQPSDKKNCRVKLSTFKDNTYSLSGCLRIGTKPQGFSVSLENPSQYILQSIKGLLDKNGVTVVGGYQIGRPTASLTPIGEHASKPLRLYIKKMLKESDNLISDSVFKKIGSAFFSQQGTWKSGSKAVRGILTKRANLGNYDGIIADGSGLSRYNLVTPSQMVKVLNFAYNSTTVAPDFIASLPISGIDGTLKYRLGAPGLTGKVKAKTGTMANVTALSGYIFTQNNHVLVFSIMINGIPGSLRKYIMLEDKICDYLIKNA